jgi:hypothetical protein
MATDRSETNGSSGARIKRAATAIVRCPWTLPATQVVGALLLLFVGADHYYQYSARDYSVIPTIGTLFLLNFISATALGLILLVPVKRWSRRFGTAVLSLAAAGGAGIAGTSLVALLISEQTKLFGFMELNYRTEIVVAIASEAAATVVLTALLGLLVRAWRSGRGRGRRGIGWSRRPSPA